MVLGWCAELGGDHEATCIPSFEYRDYSFDFRPNFSAFRDPPRTGGLERHCSIKTTHIDHRASLWVSGQLFAALARERPQYVARITLFYSGVREWLNERRRGARMH